MMEKRGALAMLKKRYCDTSIKRIASVVTKVSRLRLVVATATVIGILLVTVHVFDVRFLSAPQQPAGDVQCDAEPLHHIDGGEPSLLGVEPVLGRLMTQTGPRVSSPPGGILVGRRSEEGDAPDLSTPSVAVYSVLTLIDRNATEQLTQCCTNGTDGIANRLYPRYLGYPIELVDVAEEGNAAKVTWKATVHTRFSLNGRSWSLGESITLTARLTRVDGLWRLSILDE
jgi:hypothetical protein